MFTVIETATHIRAVGFSGVLTDAEFEAGIEACSSGAVATHSGLLDFSNVARFDLTRDGLREVAQRSGTGAARQWCAIVAPRDSAFGVARMYEIFCTLSGNSGVTVFRDCHSALDWLDEKHPALDRHGSDGASANVTISSAGR